MEEKLRQIYEEHYDFVRRSVLRLGSGEASADDAVHDVFVVVARRLGEFEGRASIKTWLFAIAVRVVQRQKRDWARHLRRVEAVAREPVSPSDAHARSEAAQIVARLLGELPEEQRIAFVLSELEGMSAREIGDAFGVSESTVYSRLRAARLALAKQQIPDDSEKRRAAMVATWKAISASLAPKVAAPIAAIALALVGVAVIAPSIRTHEIRAEPLLVAPSPPAIASVAAAVVEPPRAPVKRSKPTFAMQVAELRKAQLAFSQGGAEQALELVAAHRKKFPKSALEQERAGLEALAACKAGRADAAELVEKFLEAWPQSPLADRVARACE